MSAFKETIDIFNSIKEGEFITRKMYMSLAQGNKGTHEVYRCLLMRAGYLYDPARERRLAPPYVTSQTLPSGIYYKSKKIPENITLSTLYKQAYN